MTSGDFRDLVNDHIKIMLIELILKRTLLQGVNNVGLPEALAWQLPDKTTDLSRSKGALINI